MSDTAIIVGFLALAIVVVLAADAIDRRRGGGGPGDPWRPA